MLNSVESSNIYLASNFNRAKECLNEHLLKQGISSISKKFNIYTLDDILNKNHPKIKFLLENIFLEESTKMVFLDQLLFSLGKNLLFENQLDFPSSFEFVSKGRNRFRDEILKKI